MKPKAYIHTYGCQMNEHDSGRMAEVLIGQGYDIAESPEGASLVLLNTCSVRANPENKVYSELGPRPRPTRHDPGLTDRVGRRAAPRRGRQHTACTN